MARTRRAGRMVRGGDRGRGEGEGRGERKSGVGVVSLFMFVLCVIIVTKRQRGSKQKKSGEGGGLSRKKEWGGLCRRANPCALGERGGTGWWWGKRMS